MPVNEFEKQVQKLMDELKVAPSGNVWPKVEERIRERKRRRRLIIFPLLLGLVLFGYLASPYLFPKNKNEIGAGNIQKENTEPVNSNMDERQNPEIQKHPQNQPANKTNASEPGMKAGKLKSKPFEINITANQKVSAPDEKEDEVDSPALSNQDSNKNINADKTNVDVDKTNINANKLLVNADKPLVDADKTIVDADKTIVEADKTIVDADKTIVDVDKIIDGANKGNSQPLVADREEKPGIITPTPVEKNSSTKKLSWGMQFSPGISAINDNLFSLTTSQAMLDYVSAPAAVSGAPPRYPPSKTKKGFAFQIGPVIGKKISKRSTVSVGLLYSYYSNHIKVGTRRDSSIRLSNAFASMQSVSNYYQANPQSDYTNRYHFVELPVQYSVQLNKGKSPITWDVGVMLSRLVSSNALDYDTANRGIYFDNHKLLRKNNIGISSGFSFSIVRINKMRLSAGPHVRFSLTDFYKNDYDQNKFLLFGGIKFSLLFPAK